MDSMITSNYLLRSRPVACDRSPGEGEGRWVAPLNKGLSRSDWSLDRQDFFQKSLTSV